MKTADFLYNLPPDLIAQEPVEPRDSSRLMVLDRQTQSRQHHHFSDVPQFLRPGDVLVTNATRVFPARLRGKKNTGGKVDILLLESKNQESTLWRTLVRGAMKETPLLFENDLVATMEKRLTEGEWLLRFSRGNLRDYLDQHGEMPLPPYIKREAPRAADLDRYQTVYAATEGAVAAPTAGFHFTPALLETLRLQGVTVQPIVLHVGWGTFRPVRAETIEAHTMLPETYEVTEDAARTLNAARQEKRRIIAVGTTAVRTLESIVDDQGLFHAGKGESSLFIYPGYRFKAVDALITNFHLPDSTPLLLACAFFSDRMGVSGYRGKGVEADVSTIRRHADTPIPPFSLRVAYAEAIKEKYRFYSYGDAMLIQ